MSDENDILMKSKGINAVVGNLRLGRQRIRREIDHLVEETESMISELEGLKYDEKKNPSSKTIPKREWEKHWTSVKN